MAPDLEMNPCASLSLGLDQKWSVSVSVSTPETFRSQSRVSTRQGSGLSLNPKNLGLIGTHHFELRFLPSKPGHWNIVKKEVMQCIRNIWLKHYYSTFHHDYICNSCHLFFYDSIIWDSYAKSDFQIRVKPHTVCTKLIKCFLQPWVTRKQE